MHASVAPMKAPGWPSQMRGGARRLFEKILFIGGSKRARRGAGAARTKSGAAPMVTPPATIAHFRKVRPLPGRSEIEPHQPRRRTPRRARSSSAGR